VWTRPRGAFAIASTVLTFFSIGALLRAAHAESALPMWTLSFTLVIAFSAPVVTALLVCRKHPASHIETAVERSVHLGSVCANFSGMLVISAFWSGLQWLSIRFASAADSSNSGAELAIVIGFPVFFFIAQLVLDLKDPLAPPRYRWELRFFWQFALLLLYYQ
jgi:hypothetical protein